MLFMCFGYLYPIAICEFVFIWSMVMNAKSLLIVASALRITSHAHGSGNCNKDFIPLPRKRLSTSSITLQLSIDSPSGQSKSATCISDISFKVPGTGIHRIKFTSLNKFGLVVEQVGIIVIVSGSAIGSVVGTPRELSIQIKARKREQMPSVRIPVTGELDQPVL